ncbi:MAG: hypothetical protein K0S65_6116 [Labilithrix sp.]|nr:hypothetical protein [Labilithrix sp.]
MLRHSNVALLFVLLACAPGCTKKESEEKPASTEKTSPSGTFDTALVEAFTNASLAWVVDPDGKIRVDVRDKDGAAIAKTANGTVEWAGEGGNKSSAKLAYDDGAKALVTAGPPLKQDITELKYTVALPNDSLAGTLHVPTGGTSALVEDAKAAESAPPAPAAGPNGGVVQVVGDDRIEVLADDDSDEVRVYILDAAGKSVAVGERKVTLGVNADSSDVVVLTPSSDGAYLIGKWKVKSDPTRLTIFVKKPGKSHVAIVGWKPGAKLLVVGAPKIKIKGKGKGDINVNGGPNVKVDLKDKDDGRGKGKGKDKDDDHGKRNGKGKDK